MRQYEPRRLETLSRATQIAGGVLLEFERVRSFQYPVFLSTVKFDLLFNFLDLRLHLLKGDFGRFKGYDKSEIGNVCRLAFAPEESFEIVSEFRQGSADFEAEAIKSMTNFFQMVGLYQPKHSLIERVHLVNQRNRFALVVVPVQHHLHPAEREPLVEQYPRGESNDWDSVERRFSSSRSVGQQKEYAIVVENGEPVAVGGLFNRQVMEEVFPCHPVQMLPSTEVDIVRVADVISGITDMGTLPEQGYRLRVENGLGDIVLGLLTKSQLKAIADKLTQ